MITELSGDIWDSSYDDYWRVIPTNGSVNRLGEAVMGRGVALQAAQKFPFLRQDLGRSLKSGLRVHLYVDRGLVIFPVKYSWTQKASLTLIEKSTVQLVELLRSAQLKVVMPRVGCGNGLLVWEDVGPLVRQYLGPIPNQVVVLDYKGVV